MRYMKISLTVVLLTSSIFVGSIFAQKEVKPAQNAAISDETALSVVRVLNTAEAMYHDKNRSYGTLEQLISSGAIERARAQFTRMVQSESPLPEITGSEGWSNYKLQLNVNNTGHHSCPN